MVIGNGILDVIVVESKVRVRQPFSFSSFKSLAQTKEETVFPTPAALTAELPDANSSALPNLITGRSTSSRIYFSQSSTDDVNKISTTSAVTCGQQDAG